MSMSSWHHKKLLNNQKQAWWTCKCVRVVKSRLLYCLWNVKNIQILSDLKNKAMLNTCKQPAVYNLK